MVTTGQKVLFFVMGIQRSGGSTLLDAFRLNWKVTILREKNRKIFESYQLRPEKQIRPLLENAKSIVFIEAKSETKRREVADVFSEFSEYHVKIIWNYRNPVNVYCSRLKRYPHKDWVADYGRFSEMWNQRNASILSALNDHGRDIAIVKLEDLIESEKVFRELCGYVGAKGRNTFYQDKLNVEQELSETIRTNIVNRTSVVYDQLNQNRRFFP